MLLFLFKKLFLKRFVWIFCLPMNLHSIDAGVFWVSPVASHLQFDMAEHSGRLLLQRKQGEASLLRWEEPQHNHVALFASTPLAADQMAALTEEEARETRRPFLARAIGAPSVPRKQSPGLRGLLRGVVETQVALLPRLPWDTGTVLLMETDVCNLPSHQQFFLLALKGTNSLPEPLPTAAFSALPGRKGKHFQRWADHLIFPAGASHMGEQRVAWVII